MFARVALLFMLIAPAFALAPAPRTPALSVTELFQSQQLGVITSYPDECSSTCGVVNSKYDSCTTESCLCSTDFSQTFLGCANCVVKAAGKSVTDDEKKTLQNALDTYSSACHIDKLKLSSDAGRMCVNAALVGASAAAALAALSL